MGKLAKDETLQETNSLLRILVRENLEIENYKQIQKIVQEGKAPEFFEIGDQIIVPWKDTATDIEYSMPFDIVHFGKVRLRDGSEVDGMYLQAHYAHPFGVQFSQNEAFWYCDEELVAGTYCFTMGTSWGTNVVGGKSYQFTLTQNVPVGGQIQIGSATSEIGALPDKSPSDWRVRTYENNMAVTPIEIVTLIEGTSGTSLGTFVSSTTFGSAGLNNIQRSAYGYNRWATSALRQYLNSDKNKGQWWEAPDNVYARPPVELATKNGFMTGFGQDFLDVLKPIKITTALNTVSDSVIGVTEDTYDTFFLASKRNENLKEQLADVEGDIWDYWIEATGNVKPADYTNYAAPITYVLENHAAPQTVRLRSAYRGYACHAWCVYSTGGVNYGHAASSFRFAPACVIC